MRHLIFSVFFLTSLAGAVFAQDEDSESSSAEAATPLPSDEPPASGSAFDLPSHLQDPSFDRYVDLTLLGMAVKTQDPASLADAGLQLAEGERILGRTPKAKGISAERILRMAYELARDVNDEETLARLKKASVSLGNKTLADALAATDKLGGGSRALLGGPNVPISMPAEKFLLLKHFLDIIRRAQILGDRKSLQDVVETLKYETGLPSDQIQRLTAMAADAQAVVDKSAAPEEDALLMLTDASRQWNIRLPEVKIPRPRPGDVRDWPKCPYCNGTGHRPPWRETRQLLEGSRVDDSAEVEKDVASDSGLLEGDSRGWFESATGIRTPKAIQSIAPNGISYNPPQQGGYTDGWAIESQGPSALYMDGGGRFHRNGTDSWNELDRNGTRIFVWHQISDDANFFYIRHSPRRLVLALPRKNGTIFLRFDGEEYKAWRRATWR